MTKGEAHGAMRARTTVDLGGKNMFFVEVMVGGHT